MNALLSASEEQSPKWIIHSTHHDQGGVGPHVSGHISSSKRLGRGALVWGIGSTLLSGLGLVAFALFEQYNGALMELRNDLKHFNETSSEYVKRDRFTKVTDKLREQSKELQASSFARAQLEQELKADERARQETAQELQRMRERLAFLEGRQASSANRPPGPGQDPSRRP